MNKIGSRVGIIVVWSLLLFILGQSSVLAATKATSYSKFPAVAKGGQFVEAVTLNPDTLNSILWTTADDLAILEWIYLPLFDLDPDTYETFPVLAEKVDVSKDKKEYTYSLNAKARWSDGTAVTADDVEFTFNKLMDPKVEAAVQRGFYENVTFQKIDALHFKFKTTSPKFNTLEALNSFSPVQKKQFELVEDFNRTKENLRPIGTGPYRVKSMSRDQNVILERVTDWWAKDLADFKARNNFDTIYFKIIPDAALKYEKFLKGEMDSISLVADQYVNQVKGVDADQVGSEPNSGKKVWAKMFQSDRPTQWGGFVINLKKPIFSSLKARQALAYLTDYQTILEKGYLGTTDKAVGPFGTKTNNTAPELKLAKNQYQFDPKKALELLKADGWADTDGDNILDKMIDGKRTPFKFEFKIASVSSAQVRTAQIMKEKLKKYGVEVEIRAVEGSAFFKDVQDGNFEVAFAAFGAGSMYPDPRQEFHSKSSDGGSNFGHYSNPQVDQLIEQANLEFDRKKREKILQEISRILYKDLPWIFVSERDTVLQGLNSRIKSPKWIFRYSTGIAKDMFYF